MYEVIKTTNLSKEFMDFWGRVKAKAVENLNLSVYRGEIFGLLGPNGSGKTTTIKLLLGLLFPTSGTIKILGFSPRDISYKSQIGFLPEESYLYPYQNAEEALYFYGRLFGYPRKDCIKRVDRLLEMTGLLKARKRLIKEYSKGMARRIGIAQALINDPEVIFLDEPTSGLDPVGSKEVKDLILQLKKKGKTILLCSHLLADVEDVCDRIAILYGGKIRAEGPVKDLLSKPSVTQISIENLSSQGRKQLNAWLVQNGMGHASFSVPLERLESFFLRIVEDARKEQVSTSGAEAGKAIEDFFAQSPALPAESPRNKVIEQLLHPSLKTEEKESEASSDPDAVDPGNDLVAKDTNSSFVGDRPQPSKASVLQNLLPPQPRQETQERVPSALETDFDGLSKEGTPDPDISISALAASPTPKKKSILDGLLPAAWKGKKATKSVGEPPPTKPGEV